MGALATGQGVTLVMVHVGGAGTGFPEKMGAMLHGMGPGLGRYSLRLSSPIPTIRRDFNAFVRSTEKYGRKNVAQIATEVEGKTEAEVKQYSEVFWKRYKELGDWEKVLKNIERGEQKLQRFNDNQTAVAGKLAKYKNPWNELKVRVPGCSYRANVWRVCIWLKVLMGEVTRIKRPI